MEPISISLAVVGCVIIGAEICKYVKKKISHRTEERHNAGVTIKADELTMDGDLSKLAGEANKDSSIDANNNHMHGKTVKITIINNSSSMEHLSATHQERGGSEVAKQLAGNIMPSLISPTAALSTAVGGVIEKNASKIKLHNPFKKHKEKKKEDDERPVEKYKDWYMDDESGMEPVMLFTKDGSLFYAPNDSDRASPTLESRFHGTRFDLVAKKTASGESSLSQKSLSEPDLAICAKGLKFITPSIHTDGVRSCGASPGHSPILSCKPFVASVEKSKLHKCSDAVDSEDESKERSNEPSVFGDHVELVEMWV